LQHTRFRLGSRIGDGVRKPWHGQPDHRRRRHRARHAGDFGGRNG